MKRTSCYLAVICALALPSFGRAAELIRWTNDLATAQQMAEDQGKLLLLHFWAPDCAPCRVVDEFVFPVPNVAQAMQEKFVPVKVNASQRRDLCLQYQVDQWPTDVIATPGGQVVYRLATPQEPAAYVQQLTAVAQAHGPRPAQESRWSEGPHADHGMIGGTQRPGLNSNLGMDMRTFAPSQQSDAAANANWGYSRDATTEAAPTPNSAPRAIDNRYATEPGTTPPNSRWSTNELNNPYVQSPSADSNAIASQTIASPNVASPNVANSPSGPVGEFAPAAGEGNLTAPTTPTHPPMGLDGRCPVTLVRSRVWQKGDPRWGAVHRGRTYLFAGPEEQAAFLAAPDAFSPILAGMDVVRLVSDRRVVEGDRRFGVVFDEDGAGGQPSRIYLFDSVESRDAFESSPEQFVRPVLQAMQQGTLDTFLR